MKLENATAVLRPRGAWEAVDLGCALARQHWGRLMRGWLTVALPLWAVLTLLFFKVPGALGFFVLWTKPLLTRQPVYFMSRALFGETPRAWDFWKNWRINLRAILIQLTVGRISLVRPFRLPVTMLEGQTGGNYSRRAQVLSVHGGGSATSLTFVCLVLNCMVFCGALWAIFKGTTILDSQWESGLQEWWIHRAPLPLLTQYAAVAALMLSTALVEPFYGAAGFALYINTRTHLEGWDIEVAFRRMSARLAPGALFAAALGFLMLLAGPAQARSMDPEEARRVAGEIVDGPDFEREKVQRRVPKSSNITPKKEDWEGSGEGKKSRQSRENDRDFSPSSGWDYSVGGYAIIAAVVVVLALLIAKHRRSLRGGGDDSERASGPQVLMGMDLAPESLPEDIPQQAWREYQAGRALEAMRLLYRGALSWLVNRAAVPVHESDTEGDCLRHAQQLPDTQRSAFFNLLTAAWVNCAYAGQAPAADPMKRLCDQWPFSQQAGRAGRGVSATAAVWLLLPLAGLMLSGCQKGGGSDPDYEIKEELRGYTGKARTNPWLAAERFLQKAGIPAETRLIMGSLPPRDMTVFMPLDAMASAGEVRTMLNWVSEGGHLVVACSGTSRFTDDWTDSEDTYFDKEAPLLKQLGVTIQEGGTDESVTFRTGGEDFKMTPHSDVNLNMAGKSRDVDVVAGEKRRAVLASLDHGVGRLTLLSTAIPFRNRYLPEADHASILERIVRLQPSSGMIFLSKGELTLWDMLKSHAWMPLVACALLIVLWLWRHLPRFGQARSLPESGLRNFGVQLDEAGQFLAERAGPAALLAPGRRAVLAIAAQRGIQPGTPEFVEQMTARTGLTEEELNTALFSDPGENLVTATATLQKLQQQI